MTTFAAALADRLARDPGQPLVTFYDDATGERIELSVTTYANWVAKTASLLVEELDLGRGDRLLLDLPTHWLGPVFLGAAWTAGLAVDFPSKARSDSPAAVVCGPAGLGTWAPAAQRIPVVATALLPLGVRFAEPLPDGVHDFGVEVWSQPDAFVAWDPARAEDEAVAGRTHRALLESAAADPVVQDGGRLLSVDNPASASGLSTFLSPLVRRGSVVWVVNAGPERLRALAEAERTTAAEA